MSDRAEEPYIKHLVGREVKLTVNRNSKSLHYEAIIQQVTNSHITFIDNKKRIRMFLISDIQELKTTDSPKENLVMR